MRTGQRICAVVFCVAASGSVRADETGTGKAVFYGVAGAAGGIFDVGFTAYDLTHLSSVDRIPRSVGIVEVAGALPQVGVGHLRCDESAANRRRPRPQRGVGRLGVAVVRTWNLGHRQRKIARRESRARAQGGTVEMPRPFTAVAGGSTADDDLVDGSAILNATNPAAESFQDSKCPGRQ